MSKKDVLVKGLEEEKSNQVTKYAINCYFICSTFSGLGGNLQSTHVYTSPSTKASGLDSSLCNTVQGAI